MVGDPHGATLLLEEEEEEQANSLLMARCCLLASLQKLQPCPEVSGP